MGGFGGFGAGSFVAPSYGSVAAPAPVMGGSIAAPMSMPTTTYAAPQMTYSAPQMTYAAPQMPTYSAPPMQTYSAPMQMQAPMMPASIAAPVTAPTTGFMGGISSYFGGGSVGAPVSGGSIVVPGGSMSAPVNVPISNTFSGYTATPLMPSSYYQLGQGPSPLVQAISPYAYQGASTYSSAAPVSYSTAAPVSYSSAAPVSYSTSAPVTTTLA